MSGKLKSKFWKHPLVRDIGPDQIASLFKATPATAIAHLSTALALTFFLIDVMSTVETIAWLTINIANSGYALFRWHQNRTIFTAKRLRVSRQTIIRTTLVAISFALPWFALLAKYVGKVPDHTGIIIMSSAAAVAAAGSIQLSRIYPAAMVYLALFAGPIIYRTATHGTADYLIFATMTAGYVFYLAHIIAHNARLSIDRSRAMQKLEAQIKVLNSTRANLERFAMEDPLTNLANRREFNAGLSRAVSDAKRTGSGVSLLICDLDHFKNINDLNGHAAGDKLLVEIANRLKSAVRDSDMVARIGGDEFAIIARHHQSPKDTADFTNRLLDIVSQPVELDGSTVRPGLSIGISMFPYDAKDVDTLLTHADMSLQRGKEKGRGQYYFFDQEMKSKLNSDEVMESELRLALVEGEFELVYQPKVSIKSGHVDGFEALIRWRRPDGTTIAPGAFFDVAEERGLMPYVSDFVMKQLLDDVKVWHGLGLNPGKLAVNIHPVQIKDKHRMYRFVRDIERSSLDPGQFYLEITEGCVIGRGTEDVPELLTDLRNKGLRISLDDFGTGFASLSHLKELPVDELKIDKSFINDLLSDASNRAIVHAMVKLGTSLGLSTVAEGIETQEQHNVLMAIGCTIGQGYFYDRPLSFEAATGLLQSGRNRNIPKLILEKVTSPAISPAQKQASA